MRKPTLKIGPGSKSLQWCLGFLPCDYGKPRKRSRGHQWDQIGHLKTLTFPTSKAPLCAFHRFSKKSNFWVEFLSWFLYGLTLFGEMIQNWLIFSIGLKPPTRFMESNKRFLFFHSSNGQRVDNIVKIPCSESGTSRIWAYTPRELRWIPNMMVWKRRLPFKYGHFLVSMLNFWGLNLLYDWYFPEILMIPNLQRNLKKNHRKNSWVRELGYPWYCQSLSNIRLHPMWISCYTPEV